MSFIPLLCSIVAPLKRLKNHYFGHYCSQPLLKITHYLNPIQAQGYVASLSCYSTDIYHTIDHDVTNAQNWIHYTWNLRLYFLKNIWKYFPTNKFPIMCFLHKGYFTDMCQFWLNESETKTHLHINQRQFRGRMNKSTHGGGAGCFIATSFWTFNDESLSGCSTPCTGKRVIIWYMKSTEISPNIQSLFEYKARNAFGREKALYFQ